MATKLTRTRPGEPEQLTELQQKAAALLAKRRGENADAQSMQKMDREPRLKLPPSRMASIEHHDDGTVSIKATAPKVYPFDVQVRVYGPIPDWFAANDIVRDALKAAQAEMNAKFGGERCYISLALNRSRDDSDKDVEDV